MGSPPLVRERLVQLFDLFQLIWITPARAGKTDKEKDLVRKYRDHPRSCGKDLPSLQLLTMGWGSPPLVRERHLYQGRGVHHHGITPARAGKTPLPRERRTPSWDHPRSCGKDVFNFYRSTGLMGSPPLVRERLYRISRFHCNRRITPARAGKTDKPASSSLRLRDHPRSCGKDISRRRSITTSIGSPPLVRERPSKPRNKIRCPGITPARAGKTC